jgi:hypothetical protein
VDVAALAPGAPCPMWFRARVGAMGGRIRKIMIVALARKLLVALWRRLTLMLLSVLLRREQRHRSTSGLAFEALTHSLQGRLAVRIDNVAERAFGLALALVNELHHLDGGDQNGGDELFEWTPLFLP